jgi:glycosyltransferase involved in cell wall biosynthesis
VNVNMDMTPPIRVAHITTVDSTLRFLLLPQLLRLRDEGFEVTAISAPGPWARDLEAEGIRHLPWPHATRSWNPGADLLAFRELLVMFRRERFDLVHTHNPKPGVLGRIAGRMAGVPCVVNTVHGLYATPDDSVARRATVLALERLAARFSDLELYQSEEDLDWAGRRRLVAPDRSVLLGNGVDLSKFDPSLIPAQSLATLRRELGIPDDAFVAGTVARLVAEKGYRELFAAAAMVRAAVPRVRVLAVGPSDPAKADAIGRAEIERARGSVIFAGWREDIPSLLALMDVFVLPSWREGLPRSAIEAAAMGKPLILTDIRGCREVARHGVEGLIVPPRDPVRLAEAIELLAKDRALGERMGAAARARALERFDERKVTDLIVARYRSLLARNGRRGNPRQRRGQPVVAP